VARRIVHVPFCYFPEAVGGTEIYVRDLAREQVKRGDQVMVLAPSDTAKEYVHEGVPVVRFVVSNEIGDVSDLYTSSKTDAERFVAAVAQFSADVLHVHGAGRAVAPPALERLKERGVRVVLTYHTPTTTCVRGTLLHQGVHPCDGALDARRCTACTLTLHGVPAAFAGAVARLPVAAGTLLRTARLRARWPTALRMRELVSTRHDQTRRLLALADQTELKVIVQPAKCAWTRRVVPYAWCM
jgi:glycosyltransferase involved in cell wall biosynthesis